MPRGALTWAQADFGIGIGQGGTVRTGAILLLGLLAGPPAFARFGVMPIDMVVGQSGTVVDATIVDARAVQYRYRTHQETCGYIHEARVAESFKGTPGRTILFASNVAMAPDTRHLLFLRSYEGDFPSDQHILIEDPEDPDFAEGVARARSNCLAELPRLRSTYLHTGEFVPSRDQRSQFVAISHWIGLLPDLASTTLRVRQADLDGRLVTLDSLPGTAPGPQLAGYATGRRLVEWSLLRAWLLRHAADVVDTSRTSTDCDQACTEGALDEAAAVMLRNLAAYRSAARDRADSLAAIDAGQRTWQSHALLSCASAAASRARRDRPVLACRLRFTQARARELWLLRNAPTAPLGSPLEACDDTCLAGELEDATATMRDRLADVREKSGPGTTIASIEDGQKSWENYARANCSPAAVPEPASRSATVVQRCRLRLMQARIDELYWLYVSSSD